VCCTTLLQHVHYGFGFHINTRPRWWTFISSYRSFCSFWTALFLISTITRWTLMMVNIVLQVSEMQSVTYPRCRNMCTGRKRCTVTITIISLVIFIKCLNAFSIQWSNGIKIMCVRFVFENSYISTGMIILKPKSLRGSLHSTF
jgi:hypothetical protein